MAELSRKTDIKPEASDLSANATAPPEPERKECVRPTILISIDWFVSVEDPRRAGVIVG